MGVTVLESACHRGEVKQNVQISKIFREYTDSPGEGGAGVRRKPTPGGWGWAGVGRKPTPGGFGAGVGTEYVHAAFLCHRAISFDPPGEKTV